MGNDEVLWLPTWRSKKAARTNLVVYVYIYIYINVRYANGAASGFASNLENPRLVSLQPSKRSTLKKGETQNLGVCLKDAVGGCIVGIN